VFDPEGKYLYFLSNRDYNEVIGVYDFEFSNPKATRVFVVTLRADLPSPLAPQSDESGTKKPETPVPSKEEAKAEAKTEVREVPKDFRIDLAGIGDRVVALAIPPARMRSLQAAKDLVFYATSPIEGLAGPLPGETPAIHAYDLKDRKDHVLLAGTEHYALSFDGKKFALCRAQGRGRRGRRR